MAATALKMITRAMRLVGVLGDNETAEASEAQDTLDAMNTMLESWGIDNQSIYKIQELAVTFAAGQTSQTIGPGGDINTARPVDILRMYQRRDNYDYTIDLVENDRWVTITDKVDTVSDLLDEAWIDGDFPLRTINVYPKPTSNVNLRIVTTTPLQVFDSLTEELSMPPGYRRAIEFNLACEIAPEYDMEVPQRVERIAGAALNAVKRQNLRIPSTRQEAPFLVKRRDHRYDVRGDTYR